MEAPTTTTTLLIIRHAESESNASLSFAGQRDVALTPRGVQQARALAEALSPLPIDAVWSSDLQRAVETARPLARAKGLEVSQDRALRERDMGEYTGLDFHSARARDEAAWERFREASPDAGPPGGETHREVAARIVPAIHKIVRRHRGLCVAVVAHGAALQHVVRDLLRIGGEDPWAVSFAIDNASVTRFEISGTPEASPEASKVRLAYLCRIVASRDDVAF